MKDSAIASGVAILLAIVGVATVGVVLSRNSDTGNVLTAGGNSFAGALRCALSPIIGGGNCGTSVSSIITF